ncbi:uncharacterized protein DUF4395 [Isoptericola sp. CG 20/1183]|uniref:Uncharacterized protein DUF4395 n=1 Tax=Isoptericola halotolerans TaxID=300560 RepID=A0ABX5EFX2_9MICO|nr:MULTISPECIES: DUF4395 domain-containing protein [Isoptericola]PRZ08243.1 uncharacterized protein DUF4395 [Isoptericola halotolerans]PRZ09040.1 uncharacterized protein DUF4395 [Isoptericola sp. CG 20/1183]
MTRTHRTAPHTPEGTTAEPAGIDPRGPRVGAGITAALLAVVVLLGPTTPALVLLAVVALSFLPGAVRGPQATWQGWLFRLLVRPRLGSPEHLEDPRPPRFAQLVGLAVTGAGVVLGLAGVLAAVPWAAGIAFLAAALNATVGLCLGCELYLIGRRLRRARA